LKTLRLFLSGIIVLQMLYGVSCIAQIPVAPLQKQEVKKLKATNENLWYADSSFSDTAPVDNSSKKKATSKKKSKIYREQLSNPLNLDIPSWFIQLLKWLLYILLAVGAFFLIKSFNFGIKPKSISDEDTINEHTVIQTQEQLQAIGFEAQIAAAEQVGNYRLAIRLHFLWILKQLSQKRHIQYHIRKTNLDYSRELHNTTFSEAFRQCVTRYNYVWYGQFAINNEQYQLLKPHFTVLVR
jgi:hypothetical protein